MPFNLGQDGQHLLVANPDRTEWKLDTIALRKRICIQVLTA